MALQINITDPDILPLRFPQIAGCRHRSGTAAQWVEILARAAQGEILPRPGLGMCAEFGKPDSNTIPNSNGVY
jgi:hypothetical protein